jgi:riboflavin biosynthesis pyrimidine reductase
LPVTSEPVDLAEMYSHDVRQPDGRPFVRVNTVSALDGTVAIGGRSGDVSGPADRSVFRALRSLADVVLVGAGTVRAERYGPVKLPDDVQQTRLGRGQRALPRLAVVTRRVDLDFESQIFGGDVERPIVIAPGTADLGTLTRARLVADVLTSGSETIDFLSALGALADQGMRHVLCEGGPRLNASLVDASLVDEVCLTFSPKLAVGVGEGLVRGWLNRDSADQGGLPSPALIGLRLVHVLEQDGFLFLRMRTS